MVLGGPYDTDSLRRPGAIPQGIASVRGVVECGSKRARAISSNHKLPCAEVDMDYVDDIIAFENGDLGHKQTVALFQKLIDNGMAWSLQGFYGRMAHDLIEAGYCHV